ncbi:hypothetical protein FS749_005280 [Ceratobasidium sp. UAMH 11750]|nr:hypothetical protein FS749_005280 [Ceratobasidium sp. UAMH 11750]
MRAFSNIILALAACSYWLSASAAPSAFSRRHSRPTVAAKPGLVTRGKNQHRDGSVNNVEENTGACGEYHNNGELVVAIGKNLWQKTQGDLNLGITYYDLTFYTSVTGGQGTSTMCGRTATVTWQGKSVKVKIVDECEGCDDNSLDLSPTAFEHLADKDAGRLQGITWSLD